MLKASLATHFPAGGKSHKTMLFAVRDAKRERMKEILQHYMGTICDITFKSIYIFLDESIFIKCILYLTAKFSSQQKKLYNLGNMCIYI